MGKKANFLLLSFIDLPNNLYAVAAIGTPKRTPVIPINPPPTVIAANTHIRKANALATTLG